MMEKKLYFVNAYGYSSYQNKRITLPVFAESAQEAVDIACEEDKVMELYKTKTIPYHVAVDACEISSIRFANEYFDTEKEVIGSEGMTIAQYFNIRKTLKDKLMELVGDIDEERFQKIVKLMKDGV